MPGRSCSDTQCASKPVSNTNRSAYQSAVQQFRAKNYDVALAELRAAIERGALADNEVVNGQRLLADLYVAKGQPRRAASILETLLHQLTPSHTRYVPVMVHRAGILLRTGDIAGASQLDMNALLKTADVNLLAQSGYILTLCEQFASALQVYTTALKYQPDSPELLFNCASACRAMGDLEQAESLYDRAILLAPKDWEAYKNRSDLRRQTNARNHIDELRGLQRENGTDRIAQVQLNFALAKELEDLKRYEESFSHLQAGARARRAGLRYDPKNDLAVMAAIAETFDGAFFRESAVAPDLDSDGSTGEDLKEKAEGEQGQGIIFILGMPRTGTTLVDRLLTSVPGVVSAGEPDTFARLLAAQVSGRKNLSPEGKTAFVRASREVDFKKLGRAYSEQLKSRAAQQGAKVILDKNPMNFLYAGLIHRALPAARIVHLQRDPVDTCYAIYKTLFKTAYPFSYDQQELGCYYVAYRQLMQHWREASPGAIYDLQYEKLVTALESESRSLLKFCGLEWHPQVLDFYRQKRSGTATASAAQVRQPLYTSSIGKWRHHASQLTPLVQLLEQAGTPVSADS